MSEMETRFADGNLSEVVRVGDTVVARAAAGEPAWVKMVKEGNGADTDESLAYLRRYRGEIGRQLR